jgi:hypothetical protein
MHWEIPTRTLGLVIVRESAEIRERKKRGRVRAMSCWLAFPAPSWSVELPEAQEL